MDDAERRGDGEEVTESVDALAMGNVDAQARDDGEELEMENVAATDVREAVSENEDENDSARYQNRVLLQSNGKFETVLLESRVA
jgi:hypothetical protein